MSSHTANSSKSPLEAAQKIVAELMGMNPDHQKLALRFATETLGLQLSSTVPPAAPAAVQTTQQPQSQAPHVGNHSADIRTFKEIKAPKSDRQFAAVVAYFYQFEARPENRLETIDGDTMKEAARLAGWPQVTRWGMTLNNAKNAGYLDAAGTGKFKLSSVGENLVAITLPGNGGSVQVTKAKKKPVNKKLKKSGKKK